MKISYRYQQVGADDLSLMQQLLDCFAEAFQEPENYTDKRPDQAYLAELLASDSFIALVALDGDRVVGGLAAYELKKFEQKRSEIYIYDLAVCASHRRQGIATRLINELKPIARQRGAWVIYVQADKGDTAPTELYNKMGIEEQVLHFDISVD